MRQIYFIIPLILFIGIYFLLLQSFAAWSFTIDDVYIPFRYAKHWLSGNGLIWNFGESPVEGFSSFSFLLLSAAGMALGLDPVFLLKVAGLLGLVLTVWAVYCLSRLWCSVWLALIPCFWLLVYKGQILWAVSGLETAVYQALICFALFFLLRGIGYNLYPEERAQVKPWFLIVTGLLFALASITRPEAPVLTLLFYALAFWDRPSFAQTYYWRLLTSGSLFAACFLPYFLWRWHYFGQLFPNPIYCKMFSNEYKLDWDYVRFIWPFLMLAAVASYKSKDKRPYFFWLPTLVYLLLLWDASILAAFYNRLFMSAFAVILPLALQGLMRLLDLFLLNRNAVYTFTLYLIAGNIAFFFIPAMSLKEYHWFTVNPQQGIALRERVVQWLNRHVPEGSRVVLGDIGLIAYRSNLNFIDSYCLNNKAMAQNSHQNMYQWQCDEVMKSKPEILILTSSSDKNGRSLYTPTDACLLEKLKMNPWYHYKTSFKFCDPFESGCYRYDLFSRVTLRP